MTPKTACGAVFLLDDPFSKGQAKGEQIEYTSIDFG